MPFSEKLKLKVKQKAAFRCCRCQNIGIDVHHIIPIKDGGTDDIDNAAPLCQNCHDQFGDNPTKRKEIIQMRYWWYKRCEQKYSNKNYDELRLLEGIDKKLEDIRKGQSDISDLKMMLKQLTNKFIDNITPEVVYTAASGIVNASTASSENLRNSYRPLPSAKLYVCNDCGTPYKKEDVNICPFCGSLQEDN